MAEHRHQRDANARRKPRAAAVLAPLAVLATASAVTLGVLSADPAARDLLVSDTATGAAAPAALAAPASEAPEAPVMATPDDRDAALSRSSVESRVEQRKAAPVRTPNMLSVAVTRKAVRKADVRLWTTESLNLWSQPGAKGENLGEIEAGEKVLVTGRSLWGREEIVVGGEARWVTSGYLSEDEPLGLGAPCTNGTSVPSGVSPNIKLVHAAVCGVFPSVSTYGTFRSDGEHSQGIAVDIMVSGATGWEIANFVRENYVALGVSYVIYSQNIWSVERAGEGWRGMSDRGSTTANHYDHVHVTTY